MIFNFSRVCILSLVVGLQGCLPTGNLLAGNPQEHGFINATGEAARFFAHGTIAVDEHYNVYVSDGNNFRIRKIDSHQKVTTLVGHEQNAHIKVEKSSFGRGLIIKDNSLYLMSLGCIAKVNLHKPDKLDVVMGTCFPYHQLDAVLRNKEKYPLSQVKSNYLAFDSQGNFYTAGGMTLHKITAQEEVITLYNSEGIEIRGLAIDSQDNLYFAVANSEISVMPGSNTRGVFALYKVATKDLNQPFPQSHPFPDVPYIKKIENFSPSNLFIDAQDNLYGRDDGSIKKRTPQGQISDIASDAGQEIALSPDGKKLFYRTDYAIYQVDLMK